MAAAVNAIRKKNERLAAEAAAGASAPGVSEPKPEVQKARNLTTFVSAAYGSITPHYAGIFLPIGPAMLLPGQLKACKIYNTGMVTWSIAAVIVRGRTAPIPAGIDFRLLPPPPCLSLCLRPGGPEPSL